MKTQRFTGLLAFVSTVSIVFSGAVQASIPDGYYDSIDTSTPQALRQSIHSIIDDHTRFPYTSSSTDTWDILELADQDPNNPSNVLDIYKNAVYAKAGGGNNFYNREHSWPKSYGFPDDNSSNYPYTDTHHLFISNSSYNSSRGNKPFDNCPMGCLEKPTDFNNSRGGTTTQSNWTEGSNTDGKWETWSGRRGDVARAMFYMAVRYEGGEHGGTGVNEPDLRLTDDRALIAASNTRDNILVAYMGLKSVLLQWHIDDPVDAEEIARNDVVYSYQGNRNPFIDHPEYVVCVFQNDCSDLGGTAGDTEAPGTPTGLAATGGNRQVSLTWTANSESDIAGYHVYRLNSDGTIQRLTGGLAIDTTFTDRGLASGTTYRYQVSAVDTSNNESNLGVPVTAITDEGGPVSTSAWINELHYDNASSDVNEGVEIAGVAGTDLSGWQIVLYNGNGGVTYRTESLTGVISDQDNGFGTVWYSIQSIQNGAPDGLALVDADANVVQFLSYEGTLTATEGPANAMMSIDIGVSESSSTTSGHSLQLGGTGSQYADFTWQSAMANTNGLVNTNQSFGGVADTEAPTAPEGLVAIGGNGGVELSWNVNSESDIAGYHVYQSLDNQSFTRVTTSLETTVAYTVTNLMGDTTYFFHITAVDTSGNESDASSAESATTLPAPEPVDGAIWINEIHYDNASSDVDEGIEVAGVAGTNLSGWQIVLYNGNGGRSYKTESLTGVISDQDNGFGTVWFEISSIQNGGSDPDGMALINADGEVVQFLSYEGDFTATDGPANGIQSQDIGVSEASSTDVGSSLQLGGVGTQYSDFSWQTAMANTERSVNTNQSFLASGDMTPPTAPEGLSAVGGDAKVSLVWTANSETDLAGYHVYQSVNSTDFTQITDELVVSADYVVGNLEPDTSYSFYVTAVDSVGNESEASSVALGTTDGIEDTTAPDAPLGVEAIGGEQLIELNWNANSEVDLAGYRVYRSNDGVDSFMPVNSEPMIEVNFTDFGLDDGSSYSYYVTAIDTSGNESNASLVVSAATDEAVDTQAPAAPVGLSSSVDGTAAVLSWTSNSESDLAGYNVYRTREGSAAIEQVNSSLVTSANFSDDFVERDIEFSYFVKAVDTAGNESEASAIVTARAESDASGGGSISIIGIILIILNWLFGR